MCPAPLRGPRPQLRALTGLRFLAAFQVLVFRSPKRSRRQLHRCMDVVSRRVPVRDGPSVGLGFPRGAVFRAKGSVVELQLCAWEIGLGAGSVDQLRGLLLHFNHPRRSWRKVDGAKACRITKRRASRDHCAGGAVPCSPFACLAHVQRGQEHRRSRPAANPFAGRGSCPSVRAYRRR
jgi:hypothetical protein